MATDLPTALRPELSASEAQPDKPNWRTAITVILAGVFFAIALAVIRHELQHYPLAKIEAALRAIPFVSLGWAAAFTALSYIVITGYDVLSLRYTDKSLPMRRTIFASFSAYAISNTLGFAALTGNAVRYRLYSSWGLDALNIAVIAALSGIYLLLSGLGLVSLGLLAEAPVFGTIFNLPRSVAYGAGALLLILVLGIIVWLASGPAERRIRAVTIRRPSRRIVPLQFGLGVLDWVFSATVLFVLLPDATGLSFLAFVPVFVTAHYLGALSGLPGGIGVFEAVFLLLIPGGDTAAIAGALIAYRAIYFVLPLILAVFGLALHTARLSKARLEAGGERATDFLETIAPTGFAILGFITGSVMLLSAATPALPRHFEAVIGLVPRPVMEISHLAASAVATLILLAAIGLRRRLYRAYFLTVGLYIAGAFFTLAKGGDPKGAVLMLLLAGALFLARDAFYRRGGLQRFGWGRVGAILGAVGLAVWAGFYAYRRTDYASELWWTFGVDADASRFLRAFALVVAILLTYTLWRWLQPAPRENIPETAPETLARVREIISSAEQPTAEAHLALIGDKQFLFSESGKSFIMYGVKGRNWIAMGEPVGVEAERLPLMWAFRRLADRWNAWPSFYSVRGQNLSDFVDLGLTVQKIGEMAIVPIADFSLEGPKRSKFRQVRSRSQRDGCSFAVIHPALNSPEMAQLKAVSDVWLSDHQGREKRFSLGRFDEEVLSTQPVAVVYREGEIIAFANIWRTSDKSELSLDLMRYRNTGLNGLMDYLFIEVMLWGHAEGYRTFSLGMAPLSGLEGDRLAPLMTRLGALIFRYGGAIYGFSGLRAFKSKFNPEWEPVYLAAPSQMIMPKALGNLALLSSGGVLGLIQRGA